MTIFFRVDASEAIGSGHLMRCITIAEALRSKGIKSHFITRKNKGYAAEVQRRNFPLTLLELPNSKPTHAPPDEPSIYTSWLGCSWEEDAEQTKTALLGSHPDWLIVDHYALDANWESALRADCDKILVIDDLANRKHNCDLLVDQTFGRLASDYRKLIPENSNAICGSTYALLRPEFNELRVHQSSKEIWTRSNQLLLSMGGVDKDNATGTILKVLRQCQELRDWKIVVVLGENAPWRDSILQLSKEMPFQTEVLINVANIAQLMADSKLAIGAAGSTSWERCCLGLPTILIVLAENQRMIGQMLKSAGAALLIDDVCDAEATLPSIIVALLTESARLKQMSHSASEITDGLGCQRVVSAMGY